MGGEVPYINFEVISVLGQHGMEGDYLGTEGDHLSTLECNAPHKR